MIKVDQVAIGAREVVVTAIGEERLLGLVVQGLPLLGEEFLRSVFPSLPLFPDEDWVLTLGEKLTKAVCSGAGVPATQFVYAAVFVEQGNVVVSHAGDVRVALFQADNLVQTRDHILLNRAGGDQVPDEDIETLTQAVPTMMTRWVGPECRASPELTRWAPKGEYRLVISTSEFHGHQPLKMRQEESVDVGEGSLVRIHLTPSPSCPKS